MQDSVKGLASDCVDYAISKMKDSAYPWMVHSLGIFENDVMLINLLIATVGDNQCNGRMKLVHESFLEALKEKRRKLLRLLKTEGKY